MTVPEKRSANVDGAFAPVEGTHLDGRRVILVDDLITTGATVSACAAQLRRAGAVEVAAITVGIHPSNRRVPSNRVVLPAPGERHVKTFDP